MTKRVCKYCWLIFFFSPVFFEAQAAFADYAGWRLYHVEGEVALTRGGNRTVYRNGSPEAEGALLLSRDLLQTSSGNAEIQLANASVTQGDYTVIKLSENTSLLVDSLETGGLSLELLYGKIRVVNGSAGDSSLTIRSGNSSATIREGDAALDYVTRSGVTQPILTIHCFKGQGELIPLVQAGADVSKLPIRANETLVLEYHIPFSYVERRTLDRESLSYWRRNQFAHSAPLAMPVTEIRGASQETVVESKAEAPAATAPVLKSGTRGGRAGVIVTGLLLIGAGAVMHGSGYLGGPSQGAKDALLYGGYGSLGMGILFLLTSAIYNPQ
jgi:hypothetical protein